jgi:hypothetical protein
MKKLIKFVPTACRLSLRSVYILTSLIFLCCCNINTINQTKMFKIKLVKFRF